MCANKHKLPTLKASTETHIHREVNMQRLGPRSIVSVLGWPLSG